LDAADDNAAYTVSIGVSGVATPMGSNNSDATAADAEAVALAPAVVRSLAISSTSAAPTTVMVAGVSASLAKCIALLACRCTRRLLPFTLLVLCMQFLLTSLRKWHNMLPCWQWALQFLL
jgi:hypothetical protein